MNALPSLSHLSNSPQPLIINAPALPMPYQDQHIPTIVSPTFIPQSTTQSNPLFTQNPVQSQDKPPETITGPQLETNIQNLDGQPLPLKRRESVPSSLDSVVQAPVPQNLKLSETKLIETKLIAEEASSSNASTSSAARSVPSISVNVPASL
jgi:hypothetical protein